MGVPPGPRVIRWTDHAIAKAHALGVTQADVEAVVLEHHGKRRANTGAAAWLLIVGRLVVAYDHPDHDDFVAARVVTIWRAR